MIAVMAMARVGNASGNNAQYRALCILSRSARDGSPDCKAADRLSQF
jgi:hypothetical protein